MSFKFTDANNVEYTIDLSTNYGNVFIGSDLQEAADYFGKDYFSDSSAPSDAIYSYYRIAATGSSLYRKIYAIPKRRIYFSKAAGIEQVVVTVDGLTSGAMTSSGYFTYGNNDEIYISAGRSYSWTAYANTWYKIPGNSSGSGDLLSGDVTIEPVAIYKYFKLEYTATYGTPTFYENDASPTTLTTAHYGQTIYYSMTPITHYKWTSDRIDINVNTTNFSFDFTPVSGADGTATAKSLQECVVKTYALSTNGSTHGKVYFYANSSSSTKIYTATYGSTIFYRIEPDAGYIAPANDSGQITLNDNNFIFNETATYNADGTATILGLDPCIADVRVTLLNFNSVISGSYYNNGFNLIEVDFENTLNQAGTATVVVKELSGGSGTSGTVEATYTATSNFSSSQTAVILSGLPTFKDGSVSGRRYNVAITINYNDGNVLTYTIGYMYAIYSSALGYALAAYSISSSRSLPYTSAYVSNYTEYNGIMVLLDATDGSWTVVQ